MVKVWNLTSGEEVRTLLGHMGAVTCVKLIPRNESSSLITPSALKMLRRNFEV